MFAVVNIAGQQFKVTENTKYYVPRLKAEPESKIAFEEVLIFSDGKKTSIGTPTVKGMKVEAKVLEHVKDNKVIVFKKKRRKSYKVKNGHRQLLTRIEVTKIGKVRATQKAKAKEVVEEKAEESN
jgi:large subunit ribosomal protein L21